MRGETVQETLLQDKLISHLQGAHAMEQNSKRMLDSLISTTEDPPTRRELEHHRAETERHERLLAERLEELGSSPSTGKDLAAIGGAFFKGLADQVRGDKAGKNARDGYVVEHFEIASYELLERLAKRAGDEQTAEVAKVNRKDEEAMAKKIEKNWDKFVDLSLQEKEKVSAPA
jgi:ferritin-like metal-binding protein YciE